MSADERTETGTTCIDAGRCICGEWVSTPHRDCIALVERHIRRRDDDVDSGSSSGGDT